MKRERTDFSLTLEALTGWDVGDPENPDNAPTPMIRDILRSYKKPMCELTDYEIGELVIQHDGYPFVLDLIWPKLEANPLFDGDNYPGMVLALLIKADPEIWVARPEYKAQLPRFYQTALERPLDETLSFRESLNLPVGDTSLN